MKKKKKLLLPLALLMALTLTSCGGDDDDGDDTPERQEDTTGSNGTTGSTGTGGTSGTTGGGTTACLTNTRREEIRTFFNEVADRDIVGTGTWLDVDNEVEVAGGYRLSQTSENSWRLQGQVCEPETTNCRLTNETYSFRNGCFYVGNSRARVTSSSNTSLSFRYTNSGSISGSGSVTSGKVRIRSSTRRNGNLVEQLTFNEL